MIEPDDALIWARQDHISNLRIVDWGEHETEVALIRKGVFDSQSRVSSRARAYRAGQSAAAERIKALEEEVRLLNEQLAVVREAYHTLFKDARL
jgi:hypothetical protein